MSATNPGSQQKPDPQQSNDDLSLELRRAVGNAYSFVEGAQSVQSFSAITIEECLQAQIDLIEGAETPLRPNQLHRVDKVLSDITSAVAKIKSLPPTFFDAEPEKDNVNTAVNPTDGA
jgi:hypothetical protein